MKKVFKILTAVCLCIISLSLLSSCEKAGTELSDLMIMQGIGLDLTENGYRATVEILNNEQNGTPGGDSGNENKTVIYSSDGVTVAEALEGLTAQSGNLPMFAHNRVIVIGENAANTDLSDILDFFERNYNSRPSQLLCVAKNATAESVIRAEISPASVKSEILEKMLEESYNNTLIPRVRIIDAVNYLKDETSGVCIPAVIVQNNGGDENYAVSGCAVFGYDSTFSKYINSDVSQGVSYLNNSIKKGELTAELPNGKKATFALNKGKTRYKIENENGVLHYTVSIDVACEIVEIGADEYFNTDDGVIETLEKCAETAICKKTENAIITLQADHGADVVRYGKRLRNMHNGMYKILKNDWQTVFENSKTTVTANVTVRRIGEETFHSRKK